MTSPNDPNLDPNEQTEQSYEESAQRQAYLAALQQQANATPLWKKPIFIVAFGLLIAVGGGAAYYVQTENAKAAAIKKDRDETNRLLHQATAINKAGVESLADAKKKNIKLECSLADAALLMNVIIDPFQKREDGQPRYGLAAEGVAQQACLLLGIMAEKDPAIEKLIFDQMGKHALKIKPSLFGWMIQRLAIADVKNINKKLAALSKTIAEAPKSKRQSELQSEIWEVMGLRVTDKDVPSILALYKDKDVKAGLCKILAVCLDNIVTMEDDLDKRKSIGDEIFKEVPLKLRQHVMAVLAKACSPLAMSYYKKRLEDKENWGREMIFMGAWGNDDMLPYAMELHEKYKDDPKYGTDVQALFASMLFQQRDHEQEFVDACLERIYDRINEDTTAWQDIINKTDPDAADFIGKDAPEYKDLMEKRADLEECRRQKLSLVKKLSYMQEFAWASALLEKLMQDEDVDVQSAAETALAKMKKTTAAKARSKAKYKARTK